MSQLSLSTRARVLLRDGLRPQTPIARSHYATIVAGSVGLLLGLWALLSYGGFVHPSYFLPTPTEVLSSGARMILDGSLIDNAWASIAVIPGDGIGPEVTAQAQAVLEAVARKFSHEVEAQTGLFGGVAIHVARRAA